MKNIILILSLLFAVQFCLAQKDTSKSSNKIEIGLNVGYGIPLAGGDFSEYYGGTAMYDLSLSYKINSSYSVSLLGGYGLLPLGKLYDYVEDKSARLLVNTPPYTDLVGGSTRVIAISAELKKIFIMNSKTNIGLVGGPSFSFLEKSPIDGTDPDGTYQILEHYVHEKPFGLNVGGDINYSVCNYFALDLSLKYKMMFTSFVNDKSMGIVALQLGGVFKW